VAKNLVDSIASVEVESKSLSVLDKAVWAKVKQIVAAENMHLYDIQLPSAESEAFCIYIYAESPSKAGVGFENCVAVSRLVHQTATDESWFVCDWNLEVSSPGVNRGLRLPEHFNSAIGERVKILFSETGSGRQRSVTGTIEQFISSESGRLDSSSIQVLVEGAKSEKLQIALADIDEGNIEFKF